MSALSAPRRVREERWTRRSFKLPTGKTAYRGGIAAYDQSAGKCIPAETGAGQTDLFMLGLFYETVANASGSDMDVVVQLKREIRVVWFANDGTNPVLATDLGKTVYAVDDQTASISNASSTRSALGTAWALDSVLGVAVEVT